jgi:hypothetical protein
MISFSDSLIKFILNETFGVNSFELAGDVYHFNNGVNTHGSITRDETGWIVRYNLTPVEIVVNQNGGEADDLITALDRANALADSARMILERVADRGWEPVSHAKHSVCRFYKDGVTATLYQNISRTCPFSVVGPHAAVTDFVVAGKGMVDWR